MKYRSVFISDIHLGTRGCKVEHLNSFLKSVECDHLYLVGDIIDAWAISRGRTYFPQSHVNILRRILTMAKNGTKVTYIIGNHDEFLRKYLDFLSCVDFGNISLADEALHITLNKKRIWLVHGDKYDGLSAMPWLSHVGDISYTFLLWLNGWFNRLRSILGFKYWSLSAYIKNRVKKAVMFISSFEETLSKECSHKGYDAVCSGHIHHLEMKQMENGILYLNCSDWQESCGGIVEEIDGTLKTFLYDEAGIHFEKSSLSN